MKKLFYVLTATALLMAVMVSCKDTKVTDVQLNKTVLTLYVGGAETLIATVLPKDADNKMVSWTSSNTDVATIDHDGKITAIAEGTATITVTTEDGDKTASCTLTVTKFIEEPEMIFVEGGTFLYGDTDTNSYHYPQRQVTVNSFYIAKYPVTQKLWKDVMGKLPGSTVEHGSGIGDDYPVYYVNFPNIWAFLQELNRITGKKYHFAGSAGWEYAARGGNKSKGYKYSGSNNLDEVAWHSGNSNSSTHPVGKKLPNELGIYDMSGNVWEWTGEEFFLKVPTYFEIRGGSWQDGASVCHVSSYSSVSHLSTHPHIGLRLALSVQEP